MTKDSILRYLKEHRAEFQKKFSVKDIGLFGSYARGEATKESDIDIFVKMEPSFYALMGVKEQIQRDLNKKVDIIREHKNIKPFFLKMIQKDLINV